MSPLTERTQNLQQRLSILQNVVLPSTILIVIAGLSYFVYVVWPQIWLPVTIVLLLLGAAGIWLGVRIFKQYVSHPVEEIQAELKHPPQANTAAPPNKEPALFTTEETVAEESNSKTDYLLPALHTTEMITELTLEGVYLYVSPACQELLGYTPTELAGKSVYEFVNPKELLAMQKVVASVIKTANKSTATYRLRHQDEHYVCVETIFKLERQQDNQKSLIAISRDVTHHKQVEDEITRRTHELTGLQSAGVAITSSLDLRYVLDTVTLEMSKLFSVESCAISEWSQTGNQVVRTAKYSSSGWWDPHSEAEILHLPEHPLIKWVLDEQIPQQMTISQSNIDPAEFAYMQKTGTKTRLLLPMVFQRRVLGLVALEDTRAERTFTYQEISLAKLVASQAASAIKNAQLFEQAQQEIEERQRAEAALQEERAMLAQRVQERTGDLSKANAELARAARLKDEFLAGMSHELRTPLNAILGSAEILHTEVFGPLNEKQVKFAHNIEESGTHLLSLINDILDLSKIEAGRLELDILPVAVNQTCEASVRLVKQLAYKKQLNLSLNLDNTVTSLYADERRLKQMLVNLLSNAIKFTPQGGQIGLDVIGDHEQQVVRLTVWDTGIGIAEEDMPRLFEPFIQLDSALSRQYEGTGLGLSLVFKMAEMHGGGISVESKINEGSKFTILLPWIESIIDFGDPQSPETDSQPALPVKLPGDKPPLVLLAEDKEENISLFTDYLQSQGYIVIVARNGVEALKRAIEEAPNIILMDVQMPEMDGLEATRRIRANVDLVRIPVIALTALSMPGDKERCLAAGANEYMSKPVNLRALVRTINTQLINAGETL